MWYGELLGIVTKERHRLLYMMHRNWEFLLEKVHRHWKYLCQMFICMNHKDHSGGRVKDEHRGTNFLVVYCIGLEAVKWILARDDESLQCASVNGNGEGKIYGKRLKGGKKAVIDCVFILGEGLRKIVMYLPLDF